MGITEVSGQERLSILSYAAAFTTSRSDPVAVAVNAAPLLAWAEAAADIGDLSLRLRAMTQQRLNGGFDQDDALADNPDEFLRRAKLLYAFATAGGG